MQTKSNTINMEDVLSDKTSIFITIKDSIGLSKPTEYVIKIIKLVNLMSKYFKKIGELFQLSSY